MKYILPILLFLAAATDATFAQEYRMLAPIPQLTITPGSASTTISTFLPGLVRFAIAAAAALAVLRIVWAGFTYISTDAWGKKSDAKNMIQEALLGLLLAIGAYTILYTVNPQLVQFKIAIEKIETSAIDSDLGARPGISPDSPSLDGCVDCARFPGASGDFPGVNYKPMDVGGCAGPGVCVVNRDVGNKLAQLVTELNKSEHRVNPGLVYIRFQVTESYPPKNEYTETCRQRGKPDSGTCVYAAITNSNAPTPASWIAVFISAAKSVGLRAVYEVPTIARRDSIISQSRGLIVVPALTTTDVVMKNYGSGIPERFSIYNSDVAAVSERDRLAAECNDCVIVTNQFPAKPSGQGCLAGGPCLVHEDMVPLLRELRTRLSGRVNWRVTEMYPPTATHVSSCHRPGENAGKCVDAAVIPANGNLATVEEVTRFVAGIIQAGFTSFQYEVPCPRPASNLPQNICVDATQKARFDAIKAALAGSGHANKVVINFGATAEHAHINGPGIE